MRKPGARWALALLAVVSGGLLLGPQPATAQEETDPPITYEGWYFRAKTPSPQVETPAGPVSPGPAFPPAPQAPDGAYVVSFAGGSPGASDTGGDTGWAAFQWDVFDAVGGTVEEFVVTLTQAPDNRGDFNVDGAVIQACNIVAPWAAVPGANPWAERPTADCSTAVTPTVEVREERPTFTFDVTDFAKKWIEGTAHGFVIVPGAHDAEPPLAPFQVSFAGYGNQSPEAEQVKPQVTFRFSAGDLGFDTEAFDTGSFDTGSFDSGSFDSGGFDSGGFDSGIASPDLDVFPDDVGSVPDPTTAPAAPVADETAAPAPRRAQPASTSSGFPLVGWLVLPLLGVAFFGAGTALGPAGDPQLPRQGGVSRVLTQRRAAATSSSTTPTERTTP